MSRGLTDKKSTPVTRGWHGVDVGICLYATYKQPTKLNYVRLGWALVGLLGNIVIARAIK